MKQFFETNGAEIPASLRNEPETAPAQATYEDKDNEMLLRKATLNQAAKQHFSLFRDPFNDEIQSADDVYMTPDVRYVREAMFQTACHGGFVVKAARVNPHCEKTCKTVSTAKADKSS